MMQYMTNESRSLSRALFNSLIASLWFTVWISAGVAIVYFALLFNDNRIAVDILAYGVSGTLIRNVILSEMLLIAVTTLTHLSLFNRPTLVRSSSRGLKHATEIVGKPYKRTYGVVRDISTTVAEGTNSRRKITV
ncbi:MAG: hypothetical protein M3Q70_02920 [bacterium]|nr:hypothetical protein [bacterium]